jgi:hypothetical protein
MFFPSKHIFGSSLTPKRTPSRHYSNQKTKQSSQNGFVDRFVKNLASSLRGVKRRACALKRYGAQAWQSHEYPASYEIASLRSQ